MQPDLVIWTCNRSTNTCFPSLTCRVYRTVLSKLQLHWTWVFAARSTNAYGAQSIGRGTYYRKAAVVVTCHVSEYWTGRICVVWPSGWRENTKLNVIEPVNRRICTLHAYSSCCKCGAWQSHARRNIVRCTPPKVCWSISLGRSFVNDRLSSSDDSWRDGPLALQILRNERWSVISTYVSQYTVRPNPIFNE